MPTYEDIKRMRKSGASDSDIMSNLSATDRGFSEIVGKYKSMYPNPDPFLAAKAPTYLLNKYYGGNWLPEAKQSKVQKDTGKFVSQMAAEQKQKSESTLGGKIGGRVDDIRSSFGRFASGQQGFGSTVLQTAGAEAGVVNDFVGAGLSAAAGALPDAIKSPIKNAGIALLKSKAGQIGLSALEKGAEFYDSWKKGNPVDAANLESIVNIASLVPVGKAPKAAQGLPGSKFFKESAEASVGRVLNPTTIETKAMTQKVSPQILKKPMGDVLSTTRKGMQEKAAAAADVAGEAIDKAGPLKGSTKTSAILDYLESQKGAYVADGKVINEEGVKSIDSVKQIIEQYGDEIDDETARTVRKIFDAEVKAGKKNFALNPAETSKLEMKKRAANKIRGILAEKYPDVDKLNKEFTFWSNLEEVLAKTNARKVGQKGLIKGVATVAGATLGGGVLGSITGAIAFNAVASLIDSPAWGLVSAKIKSKIADALAATNLQEIGRILTTLPQQGVVSEMQE